MLINKKQTREAVHIRKFIGGTLAGPQANHALVISSHYGGHVPHTCTGKIQNQVPAIKNNVPDDGINMEDESKFQ